VPSGTITITLTISKRRLQRGTNFKETLTSLLFKLFDFSSLQPIQYRMFLRNPPPPFISILELSFLYSIHSCSQFQDAILFRDSILLDGIFKAFDLDNDGLIDFNEYILCLSTVSSKAPADDKLKREYVSVSFVHYLLEKVTTKPD
jgi:EF hand